jgi:hypothetical protein
MLLIPNRLWQFDVPWPRSNAFWRAKKEGHCMKNVENAARPMSPIAYTVFLPRRRSGKVAQRALKPAMSDSSTTPSGNHLSFPKSMSQMVVPLASNSHFGGGVTLSGGATD